MYPALLSLCCLPGSLLNERPELVAAALISEFIPLFPEFRRKTRKPLGKEPFALCQSLEFRFQRQKVPGAKLDHVAADRPDHTSRFRSNGFLGEHPGVIRVARLDDERSAIDNYSVLSCTVTEALRIAPDGMVASKCIIALADTCVDANTSLLVRCNG